MAILPFFENKTIGVFFGGKSAEQEISIITGEFALAELKKMGYNAIPVFVGNDGTFYLEKEVETLGFFSGDYSKKLKKMPTYSLNCKRSQNKLVFETGKFFKKEITIDFAFPAFHGVGGEDGSIQGMFEFFGIPYAGCGIWSLSTTIHKGITKNIFAQNNIPTSSFLTFSYPEYLSQQKESIEKILNTLQFPLFVKPTKAGSSIGISKVKTEKELIEAMELAFYYDYEVIVENGVANVRDLTCAVLCDGKTIMASEVQESPVGDTFFDYNKKYLEDGGGQLGKSETIVIPANISQEQKNQIQTMSKNIFSMMKGSGTMRVDFLMNGETGEILANEINPLPGTLYHHLWEKSGIFINTLLEMMIQDGLNQYESRIKLYSVHYSSGILENANSLKLKI